MHTGPRTDLDKHRIVDPDCPVRYIVTVQKLKEGWDCPFAYVLCSVAEQVSPTAIEQLLGRVLRMPKARRKRRDALNQAYAFVASASFDETAQQLKDGLVEGAGFNKLEADQIVAPQGDLGFDENAETEEHRVRPARRRRRPRRGDGSGDRAGSPASVRARVSFRSGTPVDDLQGADDARKPQPLAARAGEAAAGRARHRPALREDQPPPGLRRRGGGEAALHRPAPRLPPAGRVAALLAGAFPRPAVAARPVRRRRHRRPLPHRRSTARRARST